MCWICGKRVDLTKCKTDEHGNAVHERCYAAKLANDSRTQLPLSGRNHAAEIRSRQDSGSILGSIPRSLPALTYPEWQEPYQAALLETDVSKLREKLVDAEAAMLRRREQLTDGGSDGGVSHKEGEASHAELLAIGDAMSVLRRLGKELVRGISPTNKPQNRY
jgi:hypothetical protein